MKTAFIRGTVLRMDPEDKKKLDRLLQLAEENNQYVRQVRKGQKSSQMWKAIWWVIGLCLAASAYYALQPYIGTLNSAVSTVKGIESSMPSMPAK